MTRMSGRGVRFTPDEIATMLRMREAGHSCIEIGEALGMDRQRVYDRLRGRGRGHKVRKRPKRPVAPEPQRRAPALPVRDDGFIRPPTKAQLMGRRA